jgi:peptidoglycan/LPS O-acetylase OafA/YrhL
MGTKGRNLWLDLIRGCSALLVCLGHLRNAMLVDYSELVHPSIVIKAFYALTGLGHQAVMVFFVLSGYFVGGAVLRSGNKFSWGNYLTSRLTRIWVVLIPCLFITWAVGLIIEYYAPSVFAGVNVSSWHSGPKLGEYSANFSTFLANIFFMQTIISPVFGLNSPLWSLANEFWYYMLFPLLLALIGLLKPSSYLHRITALSFVILITWFLPKDMFYGFLIWMMGVGVYVAQPPIKMFSQNTVRFLLFITLILFGLSLAYSKSSRWFNAMSFESDFAIGLTFAFLCLMLSNLSFPEIRWPWLAKCALHLSEISYSLYLSHFPIVLLIASDVYVSHKFAPDNLHLMQFVGWGFLLIIYGSAVWWLFESRTTSVRNKVEALLNLNLKKLKWN